eukprot:15440157-Alexandrium_andersonii.AAC.1
MAAEKLAQLTVKVQKAVAHAEAADAALQKVRAEHQEAEKEFEEAKLTAQQLHSPASPPTAPQSGIDPRALQHWPTQMQAVIQGSATDNNGRVTVNAKDMEAVLIAAFDLTPMPMMPRATMETAPVPASSAAASTRSRYQALAELDEDES